MFNEVLFNGIRPQLLILQCGSSTGHNGLNLGILSGPTAVGGPCWHLWECCAIVAQGQAGIMSLFSL